MGNIWSSGVNGRRRRESRRSHPPPPLVVPPQSEISVNRYVIPAATPYHSQYPNPNNTPHPYNQYPGYYVPPPAMPMPLPASYDHGPHSNPHLQVDPAQAHANWVGGSYPCGPVMPPRAPHIEHQKAVTIRNDVNLKKETLRIEPDEENPDQFLVSFTFDATVAGRGLVRSGKIFCDYYWWKSGWAAYTFRNDNTITDVWIGTIISIIFFAKEGEDCNLTPMKENLIAPVTVHFQQGLGQKFQQPSGTGINFSIFEETDILKVGDMNIYPLVVKAEATAVNKNGTDGNAIAPTTNSQITQAVLEKEKGEYQVRVVKQILWVNGMRYELQEIYGIGNSVEGDLDGNDPGKECVICLSELRDTTILPCRHMCMCSGCAKVLRLQTTRCPICRQPVERLLEIKVNNGFEE